MLRPSAGKSNVNELAARGEMTPAATAAVECGPQPVIDRKTVAPQIGDLGSARVAFNPRRGHASQSHVVPAQSASRASLLANALSTAAYVGSPWRFSSWYGSRTRSYSSRSPVPLRT